MELRLAGVPLGQGGGVAWLPPALWGQLGVSLSFGTPQASGAGWRALFAVSGGREEAWPAMRYGVV